MRIHRRHRASRSGRPPRRLRPCPLVLETLEQRALPSISWNSYAHDPQHTGISDVASQSLDVIRWKTPVDLNPVYSGSQLLIHYGSPLVTQNNTVILPVKTGPSGGFRVEAHSGVDGSLMWTQSTDYFLPPSHGWVPSYSPTLTQGNRLYFAGAGGTIYYLDNPDRVGATTTGQLAFYGIGNYSHTLDSKVFINTPLTADSAGDLYFGFITSGSNSLGLVSGIARLGADGSGTWVAASTAAGDSNISQVVYNCAPALSNDGGTVYVAVSNGGSGYLLALDSTTLATQAKVFLRDPKAPDHSASLPDSGTASPTVGPDGDVYFGVLENPFPENNDRGWLLHFSGDLSEQKLPGAFGWDDTATVVPSTMVPSYDGPSSYLLMTKYNNYAGVGGDGVNKIAIIDPNASETDPITHITVMNEVLTHAGVTPDPDYPQFPNAVREWCINNAAVDPYTDSILANSEDGSIYRWDLSTNTFTQAVTLTTATSEAYTPTVIGANGAVYAINNAVLYALQGPAGPVVLSTSTPSATAPVGSVRLTFSASINPDTFTPAQVTSFFGPAGPVAVTGVTPVDGTDNTQFDVTFTSQTALGNYTFVISPSVQDQNGNGLDTNDNGTAGEYPADQYVGHLTIQGPKITAATPALNVNVYAPVYSVRVTFNEPMNPATFTPAQVSSFSGPNGPVAVSAVVPVAGSNNTQFDIQFPPQAITGFYQMFIGPNIRDLTGHQMDQNGNFVEGEIPGDMYYVHFGIRGPRVIASTPQNNHFAPISTVRVTFDERMDPATFTPAQVASFTGPQGAITVTGVSVVPGSNNTQFDISFDPQTVLGNYSMVIGPNIRDEFGNQMDQNGNLITGEVPGDQYTNRFSIVSTTLGPDGFGYTATINPFQDLEIQDQPDTFTIISSSTNGTSLPVDLGTNTLNFYGTTYTGNNQLYVSSAGLITFGAPNSSTINTDLTNSPRQPTVAVLWSFWSKSSGDPSGPMVLGEYSDYDDNGVPHLLILEWNQVHHSGYQGTVTFQALLSLNTGSDPSNIVLNYPNLQSGDIWAEGNNATVGIKDNGQQGPNRLLVNFQGQSPFVGTGQAILFSTSGGQSAHGVGAALGTAVPVTGVRAVISPAVSGNAQPVSASPETPAAPAATGPATPDTGLTDRYYVLIPGTGEEQGLAEALALPFPGVLDQPRG